MERVDVFLFARVLGSQSLHETVASFSIVEGICDVYG